MRKYWAIVLNLVAPGVGLILLRREWLGVTIAALFTLLALAGLWGLLIVPLVIPAWLVGVSLVGAGLLWGWSQWLLYARAKVACSPGIQEELRDLCARADQATDEADFQEACQILLVALSLDDESVEVNLRWARVVTLMGRFRQARKAWHRVLRLDRTPTHRREAIKALEGLPRR